MMIRKQFALKSQLAIAEKNGVTLYGTLETLANNGNKCKNVRTSTASQHFVLIDGPVVNFVNIQITTDFRVIPEPGVVTVTNFCLRINLTKYTYLRKSYKIVV